MKTIYSYFSYGLFSLFMIVLLAGCSGCGGVKESLVDEMAITKHRQKNNEYHFSGDEKKSVPISSNAQVRKLGPQAIQNDSVYALIFLDEEGDSIGYYDIWKNNPFDDLPFKKQNSNPGQRPMRYDVPDILLNDFKNQLSKYDVNYLEGTASIGRIDVYAHIPYISRIDNYTDYLPITYQMKFMQGFYEEFEVPGSYATVKILDNKGNQVKSVEIPNFSGQNVAVTQDGKYVIYGKYSFVKEPKSCFEIYDLNNEEVVFTHCVERGKDLKGAGLSQDGYSVLLTSSDLSSPKTKPVEIYVIKSLNGYIYYKQDLPNAQYANLKIQGDYFEFLQSSPSGDISNQYYQFTKDFQVLKIIK